MTINIGKLKTLTTLLEPLLTLASELERLASVDQAVRDQEQRANQLAAENAEAMQIMQAVRDEVLARENALKEREKVVEIESRQSVEKAQKQVYTLLAQATSDANKIVDAAVKRAKELERGTESVDAEIKIREQELYRLTQSIDKAKESWRKLVASTELA